MTKVRRKTLRSKSKSARTRTDHPAGCRINDAERDQVMADIADIKQASGHAPSLGSYTKHALLSHPRYRRMEVQLRKLLADDAVMAIDFDAVTNKLLDAENGYESVTEGTFDRVRQALIQESAAILAPARQFFADVKAILENCR